MTAGTTQFLSEREVIRDAMDRLLCGTPVHSAGKLTVKSLAEEAQVKRWVLTHRHTDLQEEFRARVAQQGRLPKAVQALTDEKTELEAKIEKLTDHLRQERETVKRLERVVNVLAVQIQEMQKSEKLGARMYSIKGEQR